MSATSPEGDLDWDAYVDALARRVRLALEATGGSQLELAGRTGLARQTIGNVIRAQGYAKSKGDPKLSTIYRVARALGVTPALLLPSVDDLVQVRPREATPEFAWSDVVLAVEHELHGDAE